jgi:aspartyl-tRNA(Asn)/glutamyl-tRNA(Gln) amidotransferase subunit A
MELKGLTIKQIHQALKSKEYSCEELVKEYIKKIKEEDSKYFCYLSLTENLALEQAKKVDEKISKGEEIRILEGIPLASKDNILIKDNKCTAASKILENYVAPYDATVIRRLKQSGAIFLGKANLDEFAMGSSTENSAFGATKNPKDTERVPGGSSGGSAAAVATGLCCASLGSDTGGSIRQPASFCGVYGFKPTYGSVSRYGVMAFASSLDQIGPLANSAEDLKTIYEAISGIDPLDSSSVELEEKEEILDIKGLKIGIPKEYFVEGIDKEVEKVIRAAIKKYEDMGAKIIEVSLPYTKYALPAYYILSTSEASTNLARFDGIRYGVRKEGKNLLETYMNSKGEGFGKEVRRRIMLGTYSLSSGYYDAYYKKALKVRTRIVEDFTKVFDKVDCLMTPVSPFPAFKIGEKISDVLSMYLSDIYTVPINLAGLPAVSVPCGEIDGLPVGLQIIGKAFEDKKILNIANLY